MVLSELSPGQSAVIDDVAGPRAVRRRLLELGLLPGTPLKLLRVAPMGDPLGLSVRDTYLSIRQAEAAQIRVTLILGQS